MNLVFNVYAFFPEVACFPLGVCICKRETDGQKEIGWLGRRGYPHFKAVKKK